MTDRSPTESLSAVMCLFFFPRTSTFAWLHHTSLWIVLCVAKWRRASVLFLVYECFFEVQCVRQAYSFYFCQSSPTVFERKPPLSGHARFRLVHSISISLRQLLQVCFTKVPICRIFYFIMCFLVCFLSFFWRGVKKAIWIWTTIRLVLFNVLMT